jgi:hypothetical protein
MTADELLAVISDERSRKQLRFTQYLKAVAYPDYNAAICSVLPDGLHYWCKARNCSATEIVAERETAWNDDDVGPLDIRLLVPEVLHGLAKYVLYGKVSILIAVGAGKPGHSELHLTTSYR